MEASKCNAALSTLLENVSKPFSEFVASGV